MARKQTKKYRYKISKNAAILAVGLLLILTAGAGIFWQVQINRMTRQQLDWLNARQFGELIKDSMERLNDLKTELPANGQITELGLSLPQPSDEFGKVLYRYSEAGENMPAEIHITNTTLVDLGLNKLNGLTHEDIMNGHSEAGACSRGFSITLSPVPNSDPTKSKQLMDGRTLYLYREQKCGLGGGTGSEETGYTDADMRYQAMNEFEAYLMQAQSY